MCRASLACNVIGHFLFEKEAFNGFLKVISIQNIMHYVMARAVGGLCQDIEIVYYSFGFT